MTFLRWAKSLILDEQTFWQLSRGQTPVVCFAGVVMFFWLNHLSSTPSPHPHTHSWIQTPGRFPKTWSTVPIGWEKHCSASHHQLHLKTVPVMLGHSVCRAFTISQLTLENQLVSTRQGHTHNVSLTPSCTHVHKHLFTCHFQVCLG